MLSSHLWSDESSQAEVWFLVFEAHSRGVMIKGLERQNL